MSLFLYEERVLVLPADFAGSATRLINYLNSRLGWGVKTQTTQGDGSVRIVFLVPTGEDV